MSREIRILIIEDSAIDCEAIVRHLRSGGLDFTHRLVTNATELETALGEGEWDIVLSDHCLPGSSSAEVLRLIKSGSNPDLPVIIVSGVVRTELAVETMRNGAVDFLRKDNLSRLGPAIEREINDARVRTEKRALDLELAASNNALRRAVASLASLQDQIVAVERFRALGQMASGIAHDFNNALMILQGSLEELRMDGTSDPAIVERMDRQILDASSVVKRLKAFYSESPIRDQGPVPLQEVLRDVREFTKPRWRDEGDNSRARIVFLPVPDVGMACVWANASQLREMLTNLVFNSCDAMEEAGGEISLEVVQDGRWILLTVADTGPGMSDEVFHRCRDPLYTTKGSKGTGLGLSIVEAMVNAFGGTLGIETEPGKGTSIRIRLRASEHPGTTQEERRRLRDCCDRALDIIVVDDEPLIVTLLRKQIESLGHRVTTVSGPLEVLSLLEERTYDLIVSDRSMPEMNGDELARRSKLRRPEIGFLMASGYGDLMHASGEIPEGVDLLIAKPASTEDLAEAICSMQREERENLPLYR